MEYVILIVIILVIVIIRWIAHLIFVTIPEKINNKIDKKYRITQTKEKLAHSEHVLWEHKYMQNTAETTFQNMKDEIGISSAPIKDKLNDFDVTLKKVAKDFNYYKYMYDTRESSLQKILSSNLEAFPWLAGVIADYTTYDLEAIAKSIDWGSDQKRLKKVADIREIRRDAKERIAESRVAYYQLEYLKQLFPNIEDYLTVKFSELPPVTATATLEKDPIRDYLSAEEWYSLSSSERNQLALDRYIQSHSKTQWQIGRDYELYIGYRYSSKGYDVDYFGSNMKLEDMGRDLIAKRDGKTAIIQCKYWSEKKLIHEKHIAQLYGTAISYCIENDLPVDSVSPILITNITLSETARKMADYLHVLYSENWELKEFPRIKCNIGKDEYGFQTKIYHLPMDQQYDNVKIENKGEFFAYTVEEAENAGFRRAYKWHNNE